jgi:hypothetical protein
MGRNTPYLRTGLSPIARYPVELHSVEIDGKEGTRVVLFLCGVRHAKRSLTRDAHMQMTTEQRTDVISRCGILWVLPALPLATASLLGRRQLTRECGRRQVWRAAVRDLASSCSWRT